MNPLVFSVGVMTLILWLIWSDSIRPRRSAPLVCWIRAALFLFVVGLLVNQLIRFRWLMTPTMIGMNIAACIVALGGTVYFVRRAVGRRRKSEE